MCPSKENSKAFQLSTSCLLALPHKGCLILLLRPPFLMQAACLDDFHFFLHVQHNPFLQFYQQYRLQLPQAKPLLPTSPRPFPFRQPNRKLIYEYRQIYNSFERALQAAMREVYLLIPLLTASNNIQESEVERVMNINAQQYQLHEINEDLFAVQLHNNQLGFAELEEILKEHEQQRAKIGILESTLINYDWNQREPSVQASSIDSLMKKAMKYKEVKEENKKLKKLLQNQLENTEKIREETQRTMKILRDEFDTLVKQMSKQNNQKDKIKLHTYKVLEKQENVDGRITNKN